MKIKVTGICMLIVCMSSQGDSGYLAQDITRACGDVERSVGDYVNDFGVPIEHLGSIGILRFDDKELTSLNGVQDLSYLDVAIATFAYNCILGSSRDPQFPDHAFQGLPNIAWLFLNDNKIENLPGSFFDDIQGLALLDLQNNELVTLSEGLFNGLEDLSVLRLSTNMLITVSTADFADLQNLQVLYLDYNSLSELPADLFQLKPMLTDIFLNNNVLGSWPPSLLNDLLELHKIDLSYNVLTSFEPESLVDGSEVVLTGNLLTMSQEEFLESYFPEVTFTFEE